MAMNLSEVQSSATESVLEALGNLYENSDEESMRGFAEAIAQAAVVAVQHVIDHAEIESSGAGIN